MTETTLKQLLMFKQFHLTDLEKLLFKESEVRALRRVIVKKNEKLKLLDKKRGIEIRRLQTKVIRQAKQLNSLHSKGK